MTDHKHGAPVLSPYAVAVPLQAATIITNQQTPTTGGVTMASQVATTTGVWRIKAWGSYLAKNSATVRSFEVTPYWGSTALSGTAVAVKVSNGSDFTSRWEFECLLVGVDTTHISTSGGLLHAVTDASLTALRWGLFNPISTAVTAGAQTVDLRFDNSASVAGEVITVVQVTIERIA